MAISRREMLTVWRRRVFYIWVAASIAVALVAMIGGPLVSTDGSEGTRWIAFVSPAVMALFVISGLGWLVLLMYSQRKKRA